MKLHSLTTLNAIDPLPKLGKKVQPKKPESPEAIRAREVEAFERGVYNAVKAAAEETGLRNFSRSFAHDGTGYIEDTPFPVIDPSMLDIDLSEPAVTWGDYTEAWFSAVDRVGIDAADAARSPVLVAGGFLKDAIPLAERSDLWPAIVAALEAL